MHKSRTPWPVATRVQYIVAFEELRRQHPGLSARRFCEATEVPYATFARWVAAWRQRGRLALADRPRRPKRHPTAVSGAEITIIRRAHHTLGWGVRRLYVHLRQAQLIRCSLSSVYRVLRRWGPSYVVPAGRGPTGTATLRSGQESEPRWTSCTCPRAATSSPSSMTVPG